MSFQRHFSHLYMKGEKEKLIYCNAHTVVTFNYLLFKTRYMQNIIGVKSPETTTVIIYSKYSENSTGKQFYFPFDVSSNLSDKMEFIRKQKHIMIKDDNWFRYSKVANLKVVKETPIFKYKFVCETVKKWYCNTYKVDTFNYIIVALLHAKRRI